MNNNQIVAKVGEKEITKRDVEGVLRNVDPKIAAQFNNPEGIKRLISQLAQQELFYLEAKENDLEKDADFIKEVERVKENLLRQYAINKFLGAVTASEDEMQEFYEANKQNFVQPESIKASHILVKEEDDANKVLSELDSGMKFEDAAKKYSMCPSKEKGGDLGFFSKGRMVPEFEEVAFSLDKEELTKEPVKTQFGYHIIKRTGKREQMEMTFAEAKDKVKSQLISQKQEKVYFDKVNELKGKYEIKMFV
ncbi:peptidylprolyl isomerase [Herbivorax sp. ANBcel31]|uniref:peptidylprolyl isomerase n=1 Tax=Herbivorax sp. ANBcel31 TaxID=3069754 RepID=UPI0027B17BBD|nr:peptidylprolyl isomerase [Herbivorax sp. ANBcel31]MDQ2086584.1 peptidylprolyl isomerase [Herbivorax sp. ANBcel31]